jgi:hypothetical protein
MRLTTLFLAFPSLISAHTVFTTLFINDANQGDGTCVRMPRDGSTSTAPIRPITGTDMVCGRDGLNPVPFTCPAPAGSKLTFEFRGYADASQPGVIDGSHKGPCAVYLKQVDDMATTPAEGAGWFKIWDSGYDESTGKWCTEKLIDDNGLLSVGLPSGLPTGYYLVRPELLALQQADKGDPQFYAGCAQLFVSGAESGPRTLDIPADKKVSIPGHVNANDGGLAYNIYSQPLALPYPIPGPQAWIPTAAAAGTAGGKFANGGGSAAVPQQQQTQGAVPAGCLLKNANWCGFEVASYSDEDGCWAAGEACFQQAKTCYDTAPPTGSANCRVWEGKCKGIQDACAAKQFQGPPAVQLVAVQAKVPGPIPGVANAGAAGGSGNVVEVGSGEAATTAAAAAAETVVPSPSLAVDTPANAAVKTPTSPAVESPANAAVETPTSPAAQTFVTMTTSPTAEATAANVDAAPTAITQTEESAAEPTEAAAPATSDGSCDMDMVSKDGTCGGEMGQTCSGSEFGGCCSANGRCGSSMLHCGCGCQSAFGQCN